MHKTATTLVILALAATTLTVAQAQGAEETEARFIVGFSELPEQARAGERFEGATILDVDETLGFATVATRDAHGFQERAHARSDVRYVEADLHQQLSLATPDDPLFGSQYGPQTVGAPAAWDTTYGSTATVCIVDTGLRHTHEDLAPNYVGGIDFVNNDGDPWDDRGHGTHVTGIAAAAINNGLGISGISDARILHAKALDETGYGYWSDVSQAVRWCADQGADAISLSLGGSSGSTTLKSAMDYAWAAGAVVMAAVGNGGCNDCVLYPAAYDNVIAVGCVYQSKDLCSFSNTGPQVDLVAPGSGVYGTYLRDDSSYVRMSGTSMSTPHVAGAVALLRAADPTLSNTEVRQLLESTAEDRGAAGHDSQYGHGVLRIDLAMAQAATSEPAPEPAPEPQPEPTYADLAPVMLASDAASPVEGDLITWSTEVQNQGDADAGAFTVDWVLDGAVVASDSVSSLAAGASVSLSYSWASTAGEHTIQVVADAAQAVEESDESDNAASDAVSVAAAPEPEPEPAPEPEPEPEPAPEPEPSYGVAMSADTTSQSAPKRSSVSYTVTVTNTGSVADTFDLSLSESTKGWGATLSSLSVSLAAGESADITVQVDTPNGGKSKSMDVVVYAASTTSTATEASLTLTTQVA